MDLTLTWDLFIIVFFAIVITYSFIIGKKESLKIIISSYIAIVAVQGIGNFIGRVFTLADAESMLGSLGFTVDTTVTSILKLVLFITIIVFLTVRAGLHMQYSQDGSMVINSVVTLLSGFATAGLLLSTLFTYIAGVALLDAQLVTNPAISRIVSQSQVMQIMLENQDLWFTLPAIVIIVAGVLGNK